MHGWVCEESWHLKKRKKGEPAKLNVPFKLDWLAAIVRVLIIAAAIGVVAWLVYRYRDRFPAFRRRPATVRATEVGGLDIRAESLPGDVTGSVRALWAQGQRRAALALLYRATLSRLVTDDGLALTQGNTEGDCLRLAASAMRRSAPERGTPAGG
ncbi:hypothetical protein LP420_03955 [Massilia sp. B-10]|nr:hypothetical protein LP420_03955 [Massilia sp. B-10]